MTSKSVVRFLLGYAVLMAVFAVAFTLVWRAWPQAPDVCYRPWQLTAILTLVFGVSFVVSGTAGTANASAGFVRYVSGAIVRGAGVLAVILPAAYLHLETKAERVALVLCVLCVYLLSMGAYMVWVWRGGRNDG